MEPAFQTSLPRKGLPLETGLLIKLAIGAVVPGAVATAALLPAWWRHRSATSDRAGSVAPTVIESQGEPFWIMPALSAAIAAAMVPILFEATAFPPAGAEEWLPLAAVSLGLLELATRFKSVPSLLRWGLRAALLALIASACARNFIKGSWSAGTSAAWIGGFVALTLTGSAVLERVLARQRGLGAPLLLMTIVGGASQILAVGYSSLKLGQAVGVMAAILGASCLIAILRPRFSLAFGGSFVFIAFTAAATFVGDVAVGPKRMVLYTSFIALSMLMPGLSLVGPFARLGGWKRVVLLLTLAGMPVGLGLAVAGLDELNREKDENDYSIVVPISAAPIAPSHLGQ